MSFIDNLDKLLDLNNLTTLKFSKLSNIGESTIRGWRTGKLPTIDKLVTICEYFNVSADSLLDINTTTLSVEISDEDYKLINAYNNADESTKIAIRKILDLKSSNIQDNATSTSSRTG